MVDISVGGVSLVLLLHQPMRLPMAITYARSREDADLVILTTERADLLDSSLPPHTQVLTFDDLESPMPASNQSVGHIVSRVERWAKGGSASGSRLNRWLRSADWRLRHVNRFRALIANRNRPDPDAHYAALQRALRAVGERQAIDGIVVFDLLDLSPALDYADLHGVVVRVR